MATHTKARVALCLILTTCLATAAMAAPAPAPSTMLTTGDGFIEDAHTAAFVVDNRAPSLFPSHSAGYYQQLNLSFAAEDGGDQTPTNASFC